jgi:hypothetical protein
LRSLKLLLLDSDLISDSLRLALGFRAEPVGIAPSQTVPTATAQDGMSHELRKC